MPASNQMPPLWPSLLLPRSGGGSELKVTFQQPENGAMEVAQKAGQQILDVLTSHIAVLDQEGVIVAVNKAWKTFGERNGGAAESIGVGVSYLAVCETSSVSGIPESSQAAAGIAQVLNGKLPHFQLEYACHSDTEFRWFRMDVTATGGSEPTGAIVAHTNLTEHKATEIDTKKLVHSLGERLDGLGVLYEVSRILADDSTDQAACLEAVASLLVRALRFPELGAARISYDGTVVSTKCFNASPWFIEKTFRTAVGNGGKIELHYLEKPVGRGWGIFVRQECSLLETAAELLKNYFERKAANESLRQSEANMAAAQRIANFGSWEFSLTGTGEVDGSTLRWSDGMFQLAGLPPQSAEVSRQFFFSLVPPEEHDFIQKAVSQAIQERRQYHVVHHLIRPGGEAVMVREIAEVVIETSSGLPVKMIGTAHNITDQVRAEEKLRESAQEQRELVRELQRERARLMDAQRIGNIGSWELDLASGEIIWSPEMHTIFGTQPAEFSPDYNRVMELIHPSDRNLVDALFKDSLRHGNACGIEHRILTRNNSVKQVEERWQVSFDENGTPINVVGACRDITKRKQQEHRLEVLSKLGRELNAAVTSQQAARIIVDAAEELFGWDSVSLGLCSMDRDQVTRVFQMDTDCGHKREILSDLRPGPPSDLAREVLAKGKGLIRLVDPASPALENGLERSVTSMAAPLMEGARLIGFLSFQSHRHSAYADEDLQMLELLADYCGGALSRIETESLRKQSEERFREMAENIGDVFYSYDPARNKLLYANEALEIMWRRPLATLLQNPVVCLRDVHPDDQRAVREVIRRQLAGEKTDMEFRIVRSNGEVSWVREVGVPILDEEGRVKRVVGTMRDVTERRVTADRLVEQAALLDKAQDAILVRDLEGRILYWNKSAERLYGWGAEEAVGRLVGELLYEDTTLLQNATAATLKQGEWAGELNKITKQGTSLVMECHWSLVRDEMGRPRSILAIDTDVTERRMLEQQYLRAQRMESIGTLAGGIAHDLNNVLAPILMSIDLLRLDERNPRRLSVLGTIEQSAKRGAGMVQQVLSFARGVEGMHLDVDISLLIREIEKIANETFLKHIRVTSKTQEKLWIVKGDPTQLHQILLNLAVNARDAMPEGGRLALGATNQWLDDQYAGLNIDARPGPYVRIQVEDTGTGMPPEVIDRIFEPFFTTKEIGKGTGLGLSTTLAIVKSHGGFLRVHSEPGKGTCFDIFLPAAPNAEPSPTTVAAALPRGSGELVLVVDDEQSVRDITSQTLEAFGYRAMVACDGGEAVALYSAHQAQIKAVLTDMMMPLIDGPTTIQVLKRMNPAVRIMAASGLNADAMVAKATTAGVHHFIPKPYTAETLLTTLKLLLAEAREPTEAG